jgi:predicted dithiol-disulfide oxidoreductase (DUF899 family)
MSDPPVVSREEWLEARRKLLAREKELTHHRDEVNAERRRLPMVAIDKQYALEGPEGTVGLADLFEGRSQLVVHHFMFDPAWDEGCPTCSFTADHIGYQLGHLHARDTTLVAVSRAPLDKLLAYRDRMGWTFPWYSSHGSDFNYDFHATLDPSVAPVEYNFERLGDEPPEGAEFPLEGFVISAFLRKDDRVFHTYSMYARGGDILMGTYNWLDLTARGRQEDWEDPPGRGDGPAQSWLHRHDEYETTSR